MPFKLVSRMREKLGKKRVRDDDPDAEPPGLREVQVEEDAAPASAAGSSRQHAEEASVAKEQAGRSAVELEAQRALGQRYRIAKRSADDGR